MASRPTLSVSRKSPLKSKKPANKKPGGGGGGGGGGAAAAVGGASSGKQQPWVDTINDLDIYKPTKEAIDAKKCQRKSKNLALAKVAMNDKRLQQDPERQRQVQQQIMINYQIQPSQNVEAILARSEQVMGICQGILNGEMISPAPLLPPPPPPTAANGCPALYPGPPALHPCYHDLQQHSAETRLQAGGDGISEEEIDEDHPDSAMMAGGGGHHHHQGMEGGCGGGPADDISSSHAMATLGAPQPAAVASPPQYMNSAALSEIAGELLVTVRELREELLQEREAREKLEREVVQQRELLVELCREVVRLQLHCATDSLQQTRIV